MNDYILLTPGPLSTSDTVKEAMLKDWCTWDDDYNLGVVQKIRKKLCEIGHVNDEEYSAILMQGSGSFSVESVIGSSVGSKDKLLIISNGSYGNRMQEIAMTLNLKFESLAFDETEVPNIESIEKTLIQKNDITHIAMVHCETTSGILNPIEQVGDLAKKYSKTYIVDAMSSFGGIDINIKENNIDFLISSANKCIQGVPGFGFIIANKQSIEKCKGKAKSLSLDLYDQWYVMETQNGKWRFTSPTHTVRAFYQALKELEDEGGVKNRNKRYQLSQKILVEGMEKLGFECLIKKKNQSCIITSFYSPNSPQYNFKSFYNKLKTKGFVIYPGKVSQSDCFRVGNIGHVFEKDMHRLIEAISESMDW